MDTVTPISALALKAVDWLITTKTYIWRTNIEKNTVKTFLDCTCRGNWFPSTNDESPSTIWHPRTGRLFVWNRLLTIWMDKMVRRWGANQRGGYTTIVVMLTMPKSCPSTSPASPSPYCSIFVIALILPKEIDLVNPPTIIGQLQKQLESRLYYRGDIFGRPTEACNNILSNLIEKHRKISIERILFTEENSNSFLPHAQVMLQISDRHHQSAFHLIGLMRTNHLR